MLKFQPVCSAARCGLERVWYMVSAANLQQQMNLGFFWLSAPCNVSFLCLSAPCNGSSSSLSPELPRCREPGRAVGTCSKECRVCLAGVPMLSVQPKGKQKGCAGCNRKIKDRYLLKALDKYWHEDCLKCACCDCRLGEVGSTLYTKANLILCRRDYLR